MMRWVYWTSTIYGIITFVPVVDVLVSFRNEDSDGGDEAL